MGGKWGKTKQWKRQSLCNVENWGWVDEARPIPWLCGCMVPSFSLPPFPPIFPHFSLSCHASWRTVRETLSVDGEFHEPANGCSYYPRNTWSIGREVRPFGSAQVVRSMPHRAAVPKSHTDPPPPFSHASLVDPPPPITSAQRREGVTLTWMHA